MTPTPKTPKPRMPKLERLRRVQAAREAAIDPKHVCEPGLNPRFCQTCCRAMDPAAEGERQARRQNAATPSDRIQRIKVTVPFDDETVEAEQDLAADDDPALVAQRLVTALCRLRDADVRKRS